MKVDRTDRPIAINFNVIFTYFNAGLTIRTFAKRYLANATSKRSRMNKTRLFLLSFLTAVVLISCQKEKSIDTTDPAGNGGGGGTAGSEVGTWKFLGIHALTNATIDITDGTDNIKTVTLSEYTSTQNTGTIKFDGAKATTTGLSYAVSFTAKGYIYENNVLSDSIEFPFDIALPATSSTAGYKKIGTDSLYFTSGGFISVDGGGGSSPTEAAGYKLRFEADKMYMKLNYNKTETETDQGITTKNISKATVEVTLQKQ
jgi:hypothetical protein